MDQNLDIVSLGLDLVTEAAEESVAEHSLSLGLNVVCPRPCQCDAALKAENACLEHELSLLDA
jgi:hypothetical protein